MFKNNLRLGAFFGALFLLLFASLAMNIVAQTATNKTPFDFDGDNKTDFVVWRPETSVWYILKSSNGTVSTPQYGIKTDKMVPGDYDGDNKTDVGVFRISSGVWYILESDGGTQELAWGIAGDIPVPADYDGDGKTDVGVFRPSDGVWYVRKSSNASLITYSLGNPLSDVPIRGDFDGDGKGDPAVWRPASGTWFWIKSSNSELESANWGLGSLGDTVGAGDYDGDNKTDLAVWRSSTGTWYVRKSSNGGEIVSQWGSGSNGDVPVPGDYDGDGKSDFAVWRTESGNWYINRSSDNTAQILQWGSQSAGDKLAPAAFIPTGAIVGKVTRADTGANIGSALVEISQQGIFKVAVVTDSLGNFSAPGLLTGKYEIRVSSINYKYAMLNEIAVLAGSTTTNNFTLSPEVVRYADDFGDNSLNETDWAYGRLQGATNSSLVQSNETNQRLEIGFAGTTDTTEIFNGIVTTATKDFTDSSIIVAVPQIGKGNLNDGNGKNAVKTRIEVGGSNTDKYQIELFSGGGTVRRIKDNETINVDSIYPSSLLSKYFRIRHNNAERQIYFESSSNGAENSWKKEANFEYTEQGTYGPPAWLTIAKVSLNMGRNTGAPTCNATPCLNPLSAFDDFKFVKNATLLANAGADQAVTVNTTPTLSGSPNGASSYKWTFTGKPEGAPNPTIANSTSQSTTVGNLSFLGDYYFQLTVSDGNGSFSTDEIRVRVVATPEATILAPSTILEDEPIVFDGTTSPGAFTYEWDFGDTYKSELGRATHVYMKPSPSSSGKYTVTLTIKNEAGATSTTTKEITVNALPTATTTVSAGCPSVSTLQGYIDAATGRTDIVINDGCNIDVNTQTLFLPYKSGSDYIFIRSQSAGSLEDGKRVSKDSSADVAKMAKFTTTGANAAPIVAVKKIESNDPGSAHHYKFQGIYFRRTTGATGELFDLVRIQADTSLVTRPTNEQYLTDIPHHFIFDRCIFEAESNANTATRRGLNFNSSDSSVLNSAFYNFRSTESDSQAIASWSTPGKHAIVNNYLEGGGENILYGGARMTLRYVSPSDITIRGNHLKKPIGWRTEDIVGSTALDKPDAKNVFELKHAKNVVFDGNVLENNWNAGQDGFIIVLTVRNQTENPVNENPWTTIQNVQLTNNKIINSPSGINILAIDDNGRESVLSSNFIFRNNLFDKIGATDNFPPGGTVANTKLIQFLTPPKNLVFDRNTFIRTTIPSETSVNDKAIEAQDVIWTNNSGFVFTNNILKLNQLGFNPTDGSSGIKFLDKFVPGWKVTNNAMFFRSGSCNSNFTLAGYPINNKYCSEFDSVQNFPAQFVNFNGGDNGNYNLVTDSLGKNYATDGTDVGGNISTINTAAGKATGGTWTLP